MDKAIEGGGGEGVELQRPIGMHMPDVWHIVNVVPCGQVPSKGCTGRARSRAGHHHPYGAGKGHLLQGVIYKVEAGANIFQAGCREERGEWLGGALAIPTESCKDHHTRVAIPQALPEHQLCTRH